MSFVHLHTHTHYTFQQALGDPEGLAKRAKTLGQSAISITDAGNMYGAFEFYEACVSEGIKPIIGVEFQISKKGRANKDKDNELYEIVLLAQNYQGYKNLISLVTRSQLEGYYNGRPRIDFELLEEYAKDIIVLSGSMYGEISQHIITGKSDEFICERINYYRNLFGSDHYYLEIQEHPDRPMQATINENIIRLSKIHGYEYVGTNNSYYLAPDDAGVQDMMSAVASGRALDDPDRATLMNGDYSVRSDREMEELFIYASKAYKNTKKIADMIDLHIEHGGYKIPVFPLSEIEEEQYKIYKDYVIAQNNNGESYQSLPAEEWLLRTLCIEGLNSRYDFGISKKEQELLLHKVAIEKSTKKISERSVEELYSLAESYYSDEKKILIDSWDDIKKAIIRRLEYELGVVELMGFNGYFCIVADFIRYGKNNGVPVGPGRGSAAGAILAYLSGITDIDPLRYGLLFERFLNPARVSMPDIDVDFSDEGRDKVLVYVRQKYGADRVTQVCTFGTLAARAAVKDAGRALGIPFEDMNLFAKLIPSRPGITLTQALEESSEFKKAYDDGGIYTKVIDAAIRLEGTVRQLGVHACAVIIAPEPMTNFCPLQPPPKDPSTTVTQFSAGPLEALGLLKMDFLGLRNLAILDRSIKIVEEEHKISVDLLKIDFEDPKVLSLFGEGDMTGVFQFESDGMRRYLKELKPSSFEDLIAMVSLYRPGPLAYIPEFIDRKFGRKIVEYPHPSLEAILKPTYGIAVYQEQIMQLVQAFAGFSLGEADILRRAIGKKKYDLLMEQRDKFIQAAHIQGHKEDLAIYIFDEIIEPFAGYGFNKSHAACYSMIAYQTAYMKTYYPTEFMVALMVSDEEDMDRIKMEINEATVKGVKILPPDINQSRQHFTYVDNTTIRFGLKAIKGLGEGPITTIRKSIEESGSFVDIDDLIARTGGDVINKKSLESLIYSGALDFFGERTNLLFSITKMTAYLKEIESKRETSQMGLFDTMDMGDSSGMHFELATIHPETKKKLEPMSFEDRMKGEKAMIGYPVSGHPLDGTFDFIRTKSKNIGAIYEWIEKKNSKLNGSDDEITIPEIDTNDTSDSIISTEITSQVASLADDQINDNDVPVIIDSQITAPEEKEPDQVISATLMGVVTEVRKIQTKTGGMMLLAMVESAGFDFRLAIFSRDYETYAPKVEEDRIIIVEGRARFDTERDEISMSPGLGFGKKAAGKDAIKSFSISQFREFAGAGDPKDQKNNQEPTSSRTIDNLVPITHSSNYYIDIPVYWTKDDLLDLKDYLSTMEVGLIPVWIRVSGIEKNTKFSIENTTQLEEWVKMKNI
ncbi:DNA polymerase III subunit alpha [Candidatus Gracilibacteria bacterium]|nr:DNA polymerase III subunit alpha [Candidatus Gracilibacteria bacterium]